jgi:hypothetical protein
MNSGQACAAGTRLLLPSKQLDAAKRAIVNAMRAVTVGDPADLKIAVGPMVSQKQYERVQSYIRKGIEEGAEVLVGGEGHPQGLEAGYFVKPTVFVNVKNDMTIRRRRGVDSNIPASAESTGNTASRRFSKPAPYSRLKENTDEQTRRQLAAGGGGSSRRPRAYRGLRPLRRSP